MSVNNLQVIAVMATKAKGSEMRETGRGPKAPSMEAKGGAIGGSPLLVSEMAMRQLREVIARGDGYC